jgi:F0F1-type ATP synthase assembly protein I
MQKWQLAFRVFGIGWFIAIAILLGVLGGLWVDGKLGTEPLFTIVGLFFGLAVAAFGTYSIVRPFFTDNNSQGKG